MAPLSLQEEIQIRACMKRKIQGFPVLFDKRVKGF